MAVIVPLADYGELLEVMDIIPVPESRANKPARPAGEVIAELVANGKIQYNDWKENELLVQECADELESHIRSMHEQEE